jgi:hypothetical protein
MDTIVKDIKILKALRRKYKIQFNNYSKQVTDDGIDPYNMKYKKINYRLSYFSGSIYPYITIKEVK